MSVAAAPAATEAGPEIAVTGFAAALSAGDVRATAALFTRDGCLITPDGTAVHGRADIAAVLAQITARRTELEVERIAVHRAGEVALVTGHLTMRSDGPEDTRFFQPCDTTMVARMVEGCWKLAVVAPWVLL
jgi:uncharacterized protein (TIGR02246 family)